MPAQWFASPFLRRDESYGARGRYVEINDFTPAIEADGGRWDAFECGGGPGTAYLCGVAMAKVGGVSQARLDAIAAAPGVDPLPPALLDLATSLSVVNNPTRNYIERTLTKSLGYTDAEITAWLGGQTIGQKSLGQLFDFLAGRWYSVVYDPAGSQVGYQGVTYPGVLACDGRTVVATGATSERLSPVPNTPANVAAGVPST